MNIIAIDKKILSKCQEQENLKPRTYTHTSMDWIVYLLNSYVQALTPSTIFRNRALKVVTKVK